MLVCCPFCGRKTTVRLDDSGNSRCECGAGYILEDNEVWNTDSYDYDTLDFGGRGRRVSVERADGTRTYIVFY